MAESRETCDRAAAVQVRNCSKEYRTIGRWNKCRAERFAVFKNLNLTVPRGVTYALLGPSGCGKTTILKCIMGSLQVDSGSINVFGHQLKSGEKIPGSTIGYMPQETTLFTLLTIEETLQYYGKILGLTNGFIKSQIKFFVEFLQLPSKCTLNCKLSGGQFRRLSFAVAVIHEPRLLILDEPTVGVDPIVRQRMWCYLRYNMENCLTTVILTTHYIEETRSANLIGLMHNKSMLAEGPPLHLMNLWKVSTLEDLFFRVCSKHKEGISLPDCHDVISIQSDKNYKNALETKTGRNVLDNKVCCDMDIDGTKYREFNQNKFETNYAKCYEDGGFLSLSRLTPIVKKNFIQLYRFPSALLFLICLPALEMVIIFLATSNKICDLDVGVFNTDTGTYGAKYLDLLDVDLIKQVPYSSYEDGYNDVREGNILGFINIERNFSAVFEKRILDFNTLNTNILFGGNLNITIDNTNLVLAKTVIFDMMTKFADLMKISFSNADELPLNFSNSFFQFHFQPKELVGLPPYATALPHEIITLTFVCQLATPLVLLFLEKNSGYLERSIVFGVTFFEIIASYVVILFVICLVQATATLIVAFVIFDALLIGSIIPVMIMAIAAGISGMSCGLLISACLNQLLIIGTLGLTFALATIGVSGMIMPMEAAAPYFRLFCSCLPFYWPIEALTNVMYRDASLLHNDALIAFAVLFIWIILPLPLSVFGLRAHFR